MKTESAGLSRETNLLQFLLDTLTDVNWLAKNAVGRWTKDDDDVSDKLKGMRARLIARIEELQ